MQDAAASGGHREDARLFGAADAVRHRTREARFRVLDADYEASTVALRNTMGDTDFEAASGEGAALSTEEAIAYAGRSRRKPATTVPPRSRRSGLQWP